MKPGTALRHKALAAFVACSAAALVLMATADAANHRGADRRLANSIILTQADVPRELTPKSSYQPDRALRHCLTRTGFAVTAWAGSPTYALPLFQGTGLASVATVLKTASAARRYYRLATKVLQRRCVQEFFGRVNVGEPHHLSFPRFGARSAAWRIFLSYVNFGRLPYTIDFVVVRKRRAVLVDDFLFPPGWPAGDNAAPSGLSLAALERQAIGSQLARPGQTSAITRSSAFDSSAEGWGLADPPGTAIWSDAGGNSGGYIWTHTDLNGRFSELESNVVPNNGGSWNSGNAAGDYGGRLGADLARTGPTVGATIGFHTNNSSVLPCRDVRRLAANWHTYRINLDPGGLHDCKTGKHLTPAQVRAALAGFDSMFVRAVAHDLDYDKIRLDNASLSGPQTALTPRTGTVRRKFTAFWRTGRKFQGSLASADDYSCAGKTRVTIFREAKKPVKVGTATTRAPNSQQKFGPASFAIRLRKLREGSYYASVNTAESQLDGNTCNAARSKSITVRAQGARIPK